MQRQERRVSSYARHGWATLAQPNAAVQPPAGWRDACPCTRRDSRVGRLQRHVRRPSADWANPCDSREEPSTAVPACLTTAPRHEVVVGAPALRAGKELQTNVHRDQRKNVDSTEEQGDGLHVTTRKRHERHHWNQAHNHQPERAPQVAKGRNTAISCNISRHFAVRTYGSVWRKGLVARGAFQVSHQSPRIQSDGLA